MHQGADTQLPLRCPGALAGHVSINDRIWFIECDGSVTVLLCGIALYHFSRDDVRMLRYVAVHLRLDGHASQQEIARAFGYSVRTQMRWEQWYRENGLAGLDDGVRSGRPRGVSGGSRVFLVQWFELGVSNREIARRLGVSEATVRRELSRLDLSRPLPVQEELFEPEEEEASAREEAREAADTSDVDSAADASPASPPGTLDVDPLCRALDRELARQGLIDDAVPFFSDAEQLPRAGVLLAVPLFVASGVLGVFERLYGSMGAAFYGLRSTVVCLFLTAMLRINRPENLKEYSPPDLGRIMGLDRMPEVKTLSRKLAKLANAKKGEDLMRGLAELRIEDDPGRVGYLYADGHTREYHGKHPLGKAHITGRRISAPGATDTWVNDAEGDPLFVVTSELNAGLTKMLPEVLAEVRGLVGEERRVTVVFDRGGYSPKLFAKLKDAGFDLITYRKGKKDPVSPEEFYEVRIARDGKQETWKIHDKPEVPVGTRKRATKEREAEPWLWMRQVSRLREDGSGMTQVLTTRADIEAVEVLVRMFGRWRQENFFKYMKAEFALDALCEYGVEALSDEADRPNPERRKLEKERAKAKTRLKRLLAKLGGEVEQNEESRRRTVRGLKIANAGLRQEIAGVTAEIEELSARIRELPARVPADELRQLKRDRRLVVDAVKMVANQSSTHRTAMMRELSEELNKLEMKFSGSELRIVNEAESPEHAIV